MTPMISSDGMNLDPAERSFGLGRSSRPRAQTTLVRRGGLAAGWACVAAALAAAAWSASADGGRALLLLALAAVALVASKLALESAAVRGGPPVGWRGSAARWRRLDQLHPRSPGGQ